MKFIVGFFAVIGVLAVLIVIGGVVFIGYGISSLSEKPEYANKDAIEKKYSKDLAIIKSEIKSEKFNFKNKLSSDILAVYDGQTERLKKYKYTGKSYSLSGDSGIGTLKDNKVIIDCVVYEIKEKEQSYYIYILDHNKPAQQNEVSKSPLPTR